ncbi:MAG: NAD(P)H-binding protein [Gammaproteobacteria bacterium]|nr:NAD(P)H-binding protein [Gammaproteobacteria bacterium]MBV9726640.1 NAD(P)H-binding protein [Gammaproteobacteria bacterium]
MAEGDGSIALLAGASGLTGALTLDALLGAPDITRVIAVTRRPLGREHPRLANRIMQFERLESQLKGTVCDVALCCLGTTLRKAGSQQRFRAVDVDCVLTFARTAKAANARRFVVMSSAGADPRSRHFYLRTKGEMEEELEGVGFESLDILQPSMLLAWRAEMRPLELLGSALMPLAAPLLRGKYAPYRAIGARTVAAAMLGATRSGRRGVQRYTYEGIQSLARLTAPRTRPLTPAKASARAR